MANFAELDDNNVVLRVVQVSNDTPTANGPLGENDMHVDGEVYCQNLFKGGNWKQSSFNSNFRSNPATIGGTYDAEKDAFINPQPYNSWTLNDSNKWVPPVVIPGPDDLEFNGQEIHTRWDEANTRWIGYNNSNQDVCVWDASTSTWSAL
jgi:hypothetical protein